MAAPKPQDEAARLAALRQYEVLDTDPEQAFDDLTQLATFICGMPISLVSLIDENRQWFKSQVGLSVPQTPRDVSFCAHAILRPRELLVVPDATADERFATNPLVTGEPDIRFYAGTPLVTPEGQALGTLCVIDRVPRDLNPRQRQALETLGRQVIAQLELRRKLKDLKQALLERDRAEAEKAAVAAEIERDLHFARQFQQSLLPNENNYPEVPNAPFAPLRLNFHHIYKPTLSLGGDFFDVTKLSDHRAGIFIADVMGHGARSALVMAMLRTFFQDLSQKAIDPGQFLTLMNEQLYDIIQGSKQFLFVSAFYLVMDTEHATATYAWAGHPAPVFANRAQRQVALLDEATCTGPALGLARDSVYSSYSTPIKAGDMILLFTDGLVEAPDATGDEFGEERMCAVIREHLDEDGGRLVHALLDAVNGFTGAATLPDDLCLVAVEVLCDSPIHQDSETQDSEPKESAQLRAP